MKPDHAAMDDMSDHAMTLHTSEGGYRLDTRRPFIPQGCDQQGRLTPTIQPAEAATDLGFEDEDAPHVDGAISVPVWLILAAAAVFCAWYWSGELAGVLA